MEKLRGEFYIIAAFALVMLFYFLSEVLLHFPEDFSLSQTTSNLDAVKELVQKAIDEGPENIEDKLEIIREALLNSGERITFTCNNSCPSDFAYWECGVEVIARYMGESETSKSWKIYSRYGWNSSFNNRHTFLLVSNTSVSNYLICLPQAGVAYLLGEELPCYSNATHTCVRLNLVREMPVAVSIYPSTCRKRVSKDIAVLNFSKQKCEDLANALKENYSVECFNESVFKNLLETGMPRVIIAPKEENFSRYWSTIKSYVLSGGVFACVGKCVEIFDIVEKDDGHWISSRFPFEESAYVEGFNSSLFCTNCESWFYYNSSSGARFELAAVGGVKYGLGMFVFVGNESWFNSSWSLFNQTMKSFFSYVMPEAEIKVKDCGVQEK